MTPRYLFNDKRQKAHQTGSFYCFGQFALVLGADASPSRTKNLCLAGKKLAQQGGVLFVNLVYFLLAEIAIFKHKV